MPYNIKYNVNNDPILHLYFNIFMVRNNVKTTDAESVSWV